MDRRRSTRLSGENAANGGGSGSIMPEVEPLSSTHAAMIPSSGNGAAGDDGSGTAARGAGTGDGSGEPVKKKQKTATGLNVLKAPTRKAKAPAFKPTVMASAPFTVSNGEPMQNGTSAKAPPPPPSERRPARRRSSAEAMLKRLDRSPSPTIASPSIANQPPVAMLGTTTTVTKGKASRLSRGKAEKARSEAGDADGLDGFGTSLQAELGNERGRWQDMIVQGDPTPIKDGANQTESQLLDLLDFGEPEEALASAPKPITPPRPAAATLPSTSYQTPSRRSRRYTVAPGTADASGKDPAMEGLIPLPIEDTPMIRRNQEMRERASRRRSSAGNRGTRMSENLGRGDINMLMRDPPSAESPSRQGVPHPAVPSEKWYKHIGSSFPEPVRVRHLLLWGLKKAAMEGEAPEQSAAGEKSGRTSRSKSKGKGKESNKRTPEGDEIVKAIMDSVTSQLAKGEIDTNIFPLPGELKEPPGALRAHPRNVANREYQATTTDFINRQKAESAQWSGIINAANARRNVWLARWQERTQELEQERPTYELPDELPSRIPQLHEWSALVHEVLEDEMELMQIDAEDIEMKIDVIHQNAYAATHFSVQATRFLDGIFSAFTQDLRNQDQIDLTAQNALLNKDATTQVDAFASISAGAAPHTRPHRDPMDLLRALAAAEASHQSEETLSAASALPTVQSAISMRAGASSSHMASVLMTPRRQAVMTPRRAPALGTTPRRLPALLSSAVKGNGAPAVSPPGRN